MTADANPHPAPADAAGSAPPVDVDRLRAEGRAAGAAAERERLVAILGAEGVKGDGRRMVAALDLATKAPEMPAEDVAAIVTAHTPPTATTQERPAASLSRRAEVPDSLGAAASVEENVRPIFPRPNEQPDPERGGRNG